MRLNFKLIFPIVFGYAVIVTMIHFFWIPQLLQDQKKQHQNNNEKLVSTLEPEIIRNVLSGDLARLYSFLDTQINLHPEDWKYLEFKDSQGLMIYPLESSDYSTGDDTVELIFDFKYLDQSIGTAKLVIDWTYQKQIVQAKLNQLETYLLIVFGSIVIVVLFWQNRQIIRPISSLTTTATDIANGNFNVSFPKHSEDEIGQLVDSFEHMLKVRRKYETELKDAKEIAEDAAITKSLFLASMSHEIRTPMNGVIGMLDLMLNSQLNDNQRRRAELAQGSAKSLLTLINDILDFSKVDADKLELEYIDFDIKNMLNDFAESMGHLAQQKELELVLDATQVADSMVIGDPGRLRQILTNIVSNAIKFTSKGEVVIVSRLTPINETMQQLQCEISDTGIGIPKSKINTLFDSFSQVDASTTRKYGGTGLGLAIAKKLVTLMRGNIFVASEENKGSRFTVTIELGVSKQVHHLMPNIDISNLNILVVDENATNRDVLSEQLKSWGASVYFAKNGQQAIDLCEKRVAYEENPFFDIGLIDMNMSGMDGAELGKILKNDERFNSIKLVMMTSISCQGDAQFFHNLGFSAYLPKPITNKNLFDALSVLSENGDALRQAKPLVTSHYLSSLRQNSQQCKLESQKDEWKNNNFILLVEDNDINQMVATGILEKNNIKMEIANNGVEALEKLNSSDINTPYTMILMDCQMPEMDGYETSQNIRSGNAGDFYKNIPIVAMTANAMVGDKKKCMDAGMDDYITKPINSNILLEKIQHWIGSMDKSKTQKSAL
ncbi:MAG: response regulator [Gammaproteobacteria bacterium]|nr:response regulator [Gammaproteobacteria bacterium]MDH5630777.1 response regulator [Gammaproteobacteria bacterium]